MRSDMANQHFYEQSTSPWHNEWADDGSDMEEMTDEEKAAAEDAARVEIERAFDEEAWHREQERGQMHLSPCLSEMEFEEDAAFSQESGLNSNRAAKAALHKM